MKQGKSDRGCRMRTRSDVADAHLRNNRRAIGVAKHVEDASIARTNHIITGTVGERSALSQSRDRAHHNPRVDCAYGVVAQAEPSNYAGGEILDGNVAFRNQFLNKSQTVWLPAINA